MTRRHFWQRKAAWVKQQEESAAAKKAMLEAIGKGERLNRPVNMVQDPDCPPGTIYVINDNAIDSKNVYDDWETHKSGLATSREVAELSRQIFSDHVIKQVFGPSPLFTRLEGLQGQAEPIDPADRPPVDPAVERFARRFLDG